jgi:hypothetical protein
VLFSGLASYLFLRSSWKAFEDEIAAFIEDEKDFRPAVKPVERAA